MRFFFLRGKLLQEADGHGVFVFLAIAGFDRADDHEDDPKDEDDGQDEKADEDKAKDASHGDVNGVADLEVEHFFAGAVEERAFGALDQPEDEGRDDVAEGKDKAGEAEQVHENGEGAVVGRRGRDSGRSVFGCGNGRRRVFHRGWIAFRCGGVNAEGMAGTAEDAEGAEGGESVSAATLSFR